MYEAKATIRADRHLKPLSGGQGSRELILINNHDFYCCGALLLLMISMPRCSDH
jgi:hypothetical protein